MPVEAKRSASREGATFQAGVRQLLHGLIVDRDNDSRDLLVRVLSGLDWKTAAFSDLPDVTDHLSDAWAIFICSKLIGGKDQHGIKWLRQQSPKAAIVLMQGSGEEPYEETLRDEGPDAVLSRPFADSSVIDAVGIALIRRRR